MTEYLTYAVTAEYKERLITNFEEGMKNGYTDQKFLGMRKELVAWLQKKFPDGDKAQLCNLAADVAAYAWQRWEKKKREK